MEIAKENLTLHAILLWGWAGMKPKRSQSGDICFSAFVANSYFVKITTKN
jgi:hypothetical protein